MQVLDLQQGDYVSYYLPVFGVNLNISTDLKKCSATSA